MPQKYKYIINREISWLSFNARVLQEAADPSVPLMERLKFLGIFSSNLDEFFRVRVGTLMRMLQAGIKVKAEIGGSPKKILNQIHDVVLQQRDWFDEVFTNIFQELARHEIFIINEKKLNRPQKVFLQSYFEEEVRPRLVPILLDNDKKFPYLKNQFIYLAVHLSKKDNPDTKRFALIEIPANILPRFITLPSSDDKIYLIMLDDVIRFGLGDIFHMFNYDKISAYTLKLTRDAEIDIQDDVTKSFFEKIARSLEQRETGQPVRFVYDKKMPKDLLDFILSKNNLDNFDNLIVGGRYHNARDFMAFPKIGTDKLYYKTIKPLEHRYIKARHSIFDVLKSKDILFHYPYHSFHHIINFLREAAIDPKVSSIRITLYRVAKNSSVINALINAINNGKKVTVVMELQARFDEEANIYWTKYLRDSGAHVIDGVPGLKVHAKLCLITRHEGNKKIRYASIGTGNFNENTARIYSDHSLLTADKRLSNEVKKVFDFFENNYRTSRYKHLLVAPFSMRRIWIKHIRDEIKNKQENKPAYIYLKMNSLVDNELIDWLYRASQAGVKIKIIARSICSIIPGIPGISEHIEAISIVDKYLEHSRIFIFCNNNNDLVFISSADWMIRNLDNRIEVAAPIYNPEIKAELKSFFEIQFSDICKARILDADQKNLKRVSDSAKNIRAQEELYQFLKQPGK
ncbi:MAG: polyphosphate kinase 1 [Calditrichaceae bacterium]|nr:polyphosphate kinase 1 [Calditrichaceae bacterium]MBN2707814.1 polyphosphate kinase 1 [Calditrichaceae bacterium]RQV96261.1 MAG: polyphosphate kinase 1 [Calditrichota bacterium]